MPPAQGGARFQQPASRAGGRGGVEVIALPHLLSGSLQDPLAARMKGGADGRKPPPERPLRDLLPLPPVEALWAGAQVQRPASARM